MPLIEVFGQTETSAALSCATGSDDYRTGTVGKPIPGIDVRLAPDGEIQVFAPWLGLSGL
jgi:long-chain acyl-CoA synthetase